jgi:YesN/AraC family two-component response regulator
MASGVLKTIMNTMTCKRPVREPKTSGKKAMTPADLPRREQILLVDDDAIFREEFVECFSGYGFIQAADGAQALKILKRPNEIDLVIMDVRMPGIDGLSLLEKIKDTASGAGTIVITGYSSKEVVLRALRGKADDFLEKPFDLEKARSVIEKVLNARKEGYRNDAADTAGKIEHVKHFLSRNSSRKVSLKDAAAAVCLSPKYLSRIFREYAGTGFNEYKLELKMAEAKNLLTQTAYNVDQISDRLGYQNTESFIRQFKKISKRTPSVYRKKMRGGPRRG